MSVTIPSLSDVTDILDTDMVMVTQAGGQTYKISGADLNKRNQAVIANSTTLTGAPLKTGNIVRAYFTADITGVNTTTGLVLNYNGSNKNVKVPKDGALANFTAQNMGGSPTVYKYLQAYTTLELLYDGTNFVIIGNPVVISSSDYTIYADGKSGIKIYKNSKYNSHVSGVKFTEALISYPSGMTTFIGIVVTRIRGTNGGNNNNICGFYFIDGTDEIPEKIRIYNEVPMDNEVWYTILYK